MPLRATIQLLLFVCLAVCGSPLTRSATEEDTSGRVDLLAAEWRRDPDNLRVALLLGGALRSAGREQEAEAVVEKSIDLVKERIEEEGDSSELEYLLGVGALFLDRNYIARERFQLAMSLDPEREEIHLGLIRALLRLGKEADALQALELAKALFPESESIKSQLAEIYERSGRYVEAIPYLEELRFLYPENSDIARRLFRSYSEAQDLDKATALLDDLVDAGALSPLAAGLEGFRVRLAAGDLRGARVALQEVSQLEPDSAEVDRAFRNYYAYQAAQAEDQGNARRAVLFWQRALERAPGDEATQYRLALAHAAVGDHIEALDLFLPLLEKEPQDPRFYAELSLTLVATDRLEAAARTLRLGFERASQNSDPEALERLKAAQTQLEMAAERGDVAMP